MVTQQAPVETFGPYVLWRKIGQGGMAEVFLAQMKDAPPDSPPVVVKRLHQDLERNPEAVDLFLTEADVTLMLDHPNVIRVHDSGEIDGRYYMAMEYISGKDLQQIFDRLCAKSLTMDPNVAAYVTAQVLAGLSYVHRAKTPTGRDLGIIHRDVTPANIFISAAGEVKLGDFGVAKLVAVENWTMAGSVKGKLGYLSPEQIAAEPPTQSIDLWASAVIMYELLAGERAFVGDNELDIMLRIKKGKIRPVRKLNKAVPRSLDKILRRALHKKERKRFPDATAFQSALLDHLEKCGQSYDPPGLVRYLTSTLA